MDRERGLRALGLLFWRKASEMGEAPYSKLWRQIRAEIEPQHDVDLGLHEDEVVEVISSVDLKHLSRRHQIIKSKEGIEVREDGDP